MKEQLTKLILRKISHQLKPWQLIQFAALWLFSKKFRQEYYETANIWQRVEKYNPRMELKFFHTRETNFDWLPYFKVAIAASVALFIGIYTLVLPRTIIFKNNTGDIVNLTLPDKSTIILDTGAQIIYKKSAILGFKRTISFEGRGYFHIAKDPKHPFNIKCNNLTITVLGTKFNVNTKTNQTLVTLLEGKVKLSDFKTIDTTIYMRPNELVEYLPKKKKLVTKFINPDIQTVWLHKTLYFNKFTLKEIKEIFKLYYGKTLIIDDSLLYYKHISGSAPADDWRLIIKALSIITNSDYTIKNDTIILKPHKS